MSAGMEQMRMWEGPARRWVAHVDMDAFFASVERLDNPELAGKPVIVANSPFTPERLRELADEARKGPPAELLRGVRGVVASASYEARVFGVRSAMPLARALVLCPDAVVLPGRFDRYREVAHRLQEVWAEFSPVVEPMSLDEAYLDMTGCELIHGSILVLAERLKKRIKEETRLTASVGVGSSKLVAKIASDLDKPDGLVVVPHGDEADTLAPLHVRALPGVGPKTAEALRMLGVATMGDLALLRREALASVFGGEHADSLLRRAVGIDHSPVEPPGDPKSISREITLVEDTSDLQSLRARLRELSDHVAWTLRRDGYLARCVYIKLRLLPAKRVWTPEGSGFGRLITRQTTLPLHTGDAQEVYATACRLLEAAHADTGLAEGKQVVRLLGVGTTSLCPAPELPAATLGTHAPDGARDSQRAEEPAIVTDERRQRLNAGIDSIRERFGYRAITLGGDTT